MLRCYSLLVLDDRHELSMSSFSHQCSFCLS
uniref:Uncharacterized protein n=1 Tax=Arundo donax TaxID=35708 RepID=A0A0A8ZCX4_ARUDO